MLRRIALNTQPMPLTLKLTDIRTYIIIAVFVGLNVVTPWAFHQFQLAGATYLPMHFFIFIAALTCGWQAGLIVGLLTPFASYFVSGMPAATILPQVAIEVTVYGILAGLLRQKYNLNAFWALLGAMAGGRLALLVSIIVIEFLTGKIYSPLGAAATPYSAFGHTLAQSWPGILAQIVLIPVILWIINRYSRRTRPE